jgi:hypothetical protein
MKEQRESRTSHSSPCLEVRGILRWVGERYGTTCLLETKRDDVFVR